MDKIRISAVRYANTYPFIYGLTESGFDKSAIIETDHPSVCAEKIISGRADLGLIPVGAMPEVKQPVVVSDYCIGADGKVRTVQMMSNSHLEDVTRIYLDYRSRTSVRLIKVIAGNFWNRNFEWRTTDEMFDFGVTEKNAAVVLIGDQCFTYESRYLYRWDLAEVWKMNTGLPFVFACWVANKALPDLFVSEFNNALARGVMNLDMVVERFRNTGPINGEELREYLSRNIDFILDNQKRRAMDLFLDLVKKL